MANLSLLPIVDDWGPGSGVLLRHGERGDLDYEHEEACLCGVDPYYLCEAWQRGEDTFDSLSFRLAPPKLRSV